MHVVYAKPFWILLEQEMNGWQLHQLDHMQMILLALFFLLLLGCIIKKLTGELTVISSGMMINSLFANFV